MRNTLPKLFQSLKIQTESMSKNLAQSADDISSVSTDNWAQSHVNAYTPNSFNSIGRSNSIRRATWGANRAHINMCNSRSISTSLLSSVTSSLHNSIHTGTVTPTARMLHTTTCVKAALMQTQPFDHITINVNRLYHNNH